MDVNKLEGDELDAAVAQAEGWEPVERPSHWPARCSRAMRRGTEYRCLDCQGVAYSTEWERGGPIIERERIDVGSEAQDGAEAWRASITGRHMQFGPTPLVAAMRAFVASKQA